MKSNSDRHATSKRQGVAIITLNQSACHSYVVCISPNPCSLPLFLSHTPGNGGTGRGLRTEVFLSPHLGVPTVLHNPTSCNLGLACPFSCTRKIAAAFPLHQGGTLSSCRCGIKTPDVFRGFPRPGCVLVGVGCSGESAECLISGHSVPHTLWGHCTVL